MLIKLIVTDLPETLDLLNSEMGALKGGEFVGAVSTATRDNSTVTVNGQVIQVANPAYEEGTADAFSAHNTALDATWYRGSRVVHSRAALDPSKLAYLVDTNVGLQFGSWTGSIVGAGRGQLTSSSPTNDQVTGKVAGYRRGMFGITLDSVAADLRLPVTGTSLTGVTVLTAGQKLYADVTGSGKLTAAFSNGNVPIGFFKGYETALGVVKTPSAYDPANPYANFQMITFELAL